MKIDLSTAKHKVVPNFLNATCKCLKCKATFIFEDEDMRYITSSATGWHAITIKCVNCGHSDVYMYTASILKTLFSCLFCGDNITLAKNNETIQSNSGVRDSNSGRDSEGGGILG